MPNILTNRIAPSSIWKRYVLIIEFIKKDATKNKSSAFSQRKNYTLITILNYNLPKKTKAQLNKV
jgi:hypothetical protein